MLTKLIENAFKWGGGAALLASTLAISDSASAINSTIGNPFTGTQPASLPQTGQSFINDPSGTGANILLNDWTFYIFNTNVATVAALPLNIYAGTGNGGTLVGSSSSTTTTVLTVNPNYSAVKWTFAGGLSLVDNNTYTATPNASSVNFSVSTSNLYPNGVLTSGSTATGFDTQFEGNFSAAATPVPIESDALPVLGSAIFMAGGIWWKKKRAQAKVADFIAKK